TLKQGEHRHVRQGLAGLPAWEHEGAEVPLLQPLQDDQCRLGQGDAMLLARLHAIGRNYPDSRSKVYLIPGRADHLPGSGCDQDQEFQRASRHSLLFAQLSHERADFYIWQGCVVQDLLHLGARWQQLVEVPSPASWVVALAMLPCSGPIEHRLD